jgi:hypothetical protein
MGVMVFLEIYHFIALRVPSGFSKETKRITIWDWLTMREFHALCVEFSRAPWMARFPDKGDKGLIFALVP